MLCRINDCVLISIKAFQCFGLSRNNLIPVTIQVYAANNQGIQILGAVILQFSGNLPSQHVLQNCQLIYVTRDSDRVFLSQEAHLG